MTVHGKRAELSRAKTEKVEPVADVEWEADPETEQADIRACPMRESVTAPAILPD